MIHSLLLRLDEGLPLRPPLIIGLGTALAIVLALWLSKRPRTALLFSAAVGLLALGLVVGLVGLSRPGEPHFWQGLEGAAERLIGPASYRRWEQITAVSLVLASGLLALVYHRVTRQQPGQRARRLLEQDQAQSAVLGSAHLCAPQTFRRWSEPDPWGWTVQGRFWGTGRRLLGQRLSLSGEDIARGVAVFGPQGSGKTQCLILPAIADRMRDGHSLIVTDVQGELRPSIERIAALTGHTLIVHNPSQPADSCRLNLCDWIGSVADAQAMAAVLLSATQRQLLDPGRYQPASCLCPPLPQPGGGDQCPPRSARPGPRAAGQPDAGRGRPDGRLCGFDEDAGPPAGAERHGHRLQHRAGSLGRSGPAGHHRAY